MTKEQKEQWKIKVKEYLSKTTKEIKEKNNKTLEQVHIKMKPELRKLDKKSLYDFLFFSQEKIDAYIEDSLTAIESENPLIVQALNHLQKSTLMAICAIIDFSETVKEIVKEK